MKKPQLLAITDTHLGPKNVELIIPIFKQVIAIALKFNLSVIYHMGDMFDSRKYQTLDTLMALSKILDMLEEAGIILRCIPGNHDKPDYFRERSYLDVYTKHKSLELIRDYKKFPEGDFMIHMIPFFDEKEVYPQYLEKVKISPSLTNILMTHVAVNGVKNNDGSEIEDTLAIAKFKDFEKVLVGHYHNKQEVKNVIYTGSAFQKDYGEDGDKGVTVLYQDGSLEQIKLEFPRFETVKINLNTITNEELDKKFKSHKNSQDNIRFKFSGTKEKLAALDRPKYAKVGIDIKTEQDDPIVDIDYAELIDFTGFDKSKILDEWDDFQEKHTIEEEISTEGRSRLQETFKT